MAKQSSARKMRKQYCQLLPLLQGTAKYVERILEDLPKQEFELETNIKPYKRTSEKANERKIKDLRDLSDLVRGRIYYSDNFNHKEVLDLLCEIFDDNLDVKDVEWKEKNDHGLHYEGVLHMDLKIGDVKFELQIMPVEFKPFKETLHKIYEMLRSQDENMSEEKREALKKLNNKMYKKIVEKAKKNRSSSSKD